MPGLLSVWLVIGAGVLLSNAPFVLDRLLLVRLTNGAARAGWRSISLLVAYGAFMGLALFAEHRLHGGLYGKHWEFWVVTFSLFLVSAFPGFVWRYLRTNRG